MKGGVKREKHAGLSTLNNLEACNVHEGVEALSWLLSFVYVLVIIMVSNEFRLIHDVSLKWKPIPADKPSPGMSDKFLTHHNLRLTPTAQLLRAGQSPFSLQPWRRR